MSDVLLPEGMRPTNLVLPPHMRAKFVDGDVQGICQQLREIDPSLFVVLLQDTDAGDHAWAIMERCKDGVERLVFKTQDLDGRVIKKIRRLMGVPFEQRYREAEEEAAKAERQARENEMDEFVERFGLPMWHQLEHDGFIESRGKSFPKAGPATRGKKRGGRR